MQTAAPLLDATEQRPLDATDASPSGFSNELESQYRIASDLGSGREDRVDIFEDIIDSEVGDTDLVRARNIERLLKSGELPLRNGISVASKSRAELRQLYLKFDGGNPTGTQKDRIAFAQAMDALRRGFDTICIATCGNYGAAMSLAASLAGLRCVIYIPEVYNAKRVPEMVERGAVTVRVRGDYETAVVLSRQRADTEEWYDANPGGPNLAIQLKAYGEIAYEIYDELRDAPAAVAVPVSNGITLAGIYRGFLSLYRRGKTSRLPRMVAGSSFRKNPIVRAALSGHGTCEDLPPRTIRETTVNEPLVNGHSIDGNHALESIHATDGWGGYASDRAMKTFARILRDQQRLSVLPASTAGLIALLDRHHREPLSNDRYVAVLTGRRA